MTQNVMVTAAALVTQMTILSGTVQRRTHPYCPAYFLTALIHIMPRLCNTHLR